MDIFERSLFCLPQLPKQEGDWRKGAFFRTQGSVIQDWMLVLAIADHGRAGWTMSWLVG